MTLKASTGETKTPSHRVWFLGTILILGVVAPLILEFFTNYRLTPRVRNALSYAIGGVFISWAVLTWLPGSRPMSRINRFVIAALVAVVAVVLSWTVQWILARGHS